MKKLFLLLVAVLSIGLMASAQTRTVSGTVLNAEDDEPMIGVSVLPYGENRGVQTDIDGNFSITVPTSVAKLTFAYVGMQPQTLDIPSNGKMTVRLTTKDNVLDEVMVVAYGTTTKAAFTGSAAVVDASQLEDALVANVTNAFSGKMAGVQTLSSNGQPGTGATVLVRGVGSINASTSPLWVVNGMPYDGDISAIPTNDIESITVLKDAASTALYGARGANGVILVTTKKGQAGNAKITVDARWGSNSRAIPQYDYITDQRQFLETCYQALNMTGQFYQGLSPEDAHAYANTQIWDRLGGYQTWTIPEGQSAFGTNGKFNPNATPGYNLGNYYLLADDWTKASLIHGTRQEYTVSITGGSDKLNYYLSGAYLNDEGIIKSSHFKRFSTRTNIEYQAKPWLKVGTQMGYIYTNSAYPDEQTTSGSSANVFYLLSQMGPVFPMYVRNPDGTIMHNAFNGRPIYDYGDGADYGNGRMGTSRPVMLLSNPVSDNIYNIADYLSDIFDGKWYGVLTPFKGFSLTETLSFYVDNTRAHQVRNSLYGQSANYGGEVVQEADHMRSLQSQTLVSYSFSIGENHNFDILGAFESQEYQTEYVYGQKQNLYNPGSFVVDNAIDNPHAGGGQSTLSHRGWLGKFNYNYANKYFFMASIRRDGSSRFAPDKRWGTFWSASAAADLSKEAFLRELSWINLLKVKASFGQNGNDGIPCSGNIAYLDMYRMSGSDGIFSDATLTFKGNPDITWETSNSSNIGVDFAFWNGKLQGSVEWYNRQTSDMLFNIPVAPSLGYSSIPMNVGSMRNNGWEIDLSYDLIRSRHIQLTVSGNITFQKNKILKLDSSIIDKDGYQWISEYRFRKEGESMYQLALPKYAGVDAETGDALYYALKDKTDEGGNIEYKNKRGDVIYANSDGYIIGKDEAGNPVVTEDKVDTNNYSPVKEEYKTNNYFAARETNKWHTGDLMPKAYGGFALDFKAYGFDFSAQFAYQLGGRIIDNGYQSAMNPGSGSFGQNWHKDILNAWTPDNKNTNVPRLYTDSETPYANATSDRFLISSNYLSLNNVTIGYTLPKKLTKAIQINAVRFYASAENVALWSKRKGLDPRQDFVSSDNSVYSPIRSVCGGVKVEF